MACFIVPATEAIVTTVVTKIVKSKEKDGGDNSSQLAVRFSDKLKWLNNMLWGGSALLAFEHLWHGEISPFFPFLTAASDPADTAEMLHEMATVGTGMAAVVTGAWVVMVLASGYIAKKNSPVSEIKAEGAGS